MAVDRAPVIEDVKLCVNIKTEVIAKAKSEGVQYLRTTTVPRHRARASCPRQAQSCTRTVLLVPAAYTVTTLLVQDSDRSREQGGSAGSYTTRVVL